MVTVEVGDVIKAIHDKANGGLDSDDIDAIFEILAEDDKIEDILDRIPDDILLDYITSYDIVAVLEAFADVYGERAIAENLINMGKEMVETLKEVINKDEGVNEK